MTSVLIGLLGGGVAIVAVFMLLYGLTPLRGRDSAVVTAALTVGIYGTVAILAWPGADVFAIHMAIYLVIIYILAIVTHQRDAQPAGGRVRGWFHWGPALIVMFFAVVVAVNSVFLTVAEKGMDAQIARWILPGEDSSAVRSVFPGTVPRDFQEREELYNRYLERVEQQRERGWQVQRGWVGPAVAGEPAVFRIRVTDRDGEPVLGAAVTGAFLRPSDSRRDQPFSMPEIGDGLYEIEVVLPEPGLWNLLLEVRRGDDVHELQARTQVAPSDGAG